MAIHAEQDRKDAITGNVVSINQLMHTLSGLIERADVQSLPVLVHLLFAAKNQIVLWSAYGDLYTHIHKRMAHQMKVCMPRPGAPHVIDNAALAIIHELEQLIADARASKLATVAHILTECRGQITLWAAGSTRAPARERVAQQWRRIAPQLVKPAPQAQRRARLLYTQHWFPWVMFAVAVLEFAVYFSCFKG